MKIKIGINGIGRIGKLVFRLAAVCDDLELVHVNDPMDPAMMAHLLVRDSVHGKFPHPVTAGNGFLETEGKRIKVTSAMSPADIPWDDSGVRIIIESSGRFKTRHAMEPHMKGRVEKVILTCPADDEVDRTVVMGVNHHKLLPGDRFISNASCTTNCVAPMLKVMHESFGIRKAFMNTVHPYTNNQTLLDGAHNDYRRARAAAANLIPTTTSAIRAVAIVLPELRGRFDGFATRVPIPDGSFVELTALTEKPATPALIREVFANASLHSLKGILEYCTDPIVSSDIIGNPHSCIFDSLCTRVIDGDLVQILAWYDNEAGYSNRILDLTRHIAKLP